MDELLRRHAPPCGSQSAPVESLPQLRALLPAVGAWQAKALYRRALALERLQHLTEALSDLEEALKLEPGDQAIQRQLRQLRARQRQAELRPEKMFKGILERERQEREKEAGQVALLV